MSNWPPEQWPGLHSIKPRDRRIPWPPPDQEAAHLEHTQLVDENVRLRNALTELYGAAHGYLNVVGARGRMRAGPLLVMFGPKLRRLTGRLPPAAPRSG